MMKYKTLLFCLFALIQTAKSQSSNTANVGKPDTVTLFRSGEKGYGNYRIPSIITALKGTLLAFCEGRKKPGDSGDIDILFRRSANGGLTWSEQKVIWDDSTNTCGNPCAVIDAETGMIWLLMTHNLGTDKESAITHKTAAGTRTVWLCKSEDDGRTWTNPVDITSTTKNPSWGWYATGPGIGIQIKHGPNTGRLIIPCDHSYEEPNDTGTGNSYISGSHIIYSDDHGKTWQPGGSITPKVNECQVVEVADGNGTLLMNMRSNFGRHYRTQSISYDGGLSWTQPEDVPSLVEPVCQASIIRYSFADKNIKVKSKIKNRKTSIKNSNEKVIPEAGRMYHAKIF
jgi:sialidase-1